MGSGHAGAVDSNCSVEKGDRLKGPSGRDVLRNRAVRILGGRARGRAVGGLKEVDGLAWCSTTCARLARGYYRESKDSGRGPKASCLLYLRWDVEYILDDVKIIIV